MESVNIHIQVADNCPGIQGQDDDPESIEAAKDTVLLMFRQSDELSELAHTLEIDFNADVKFNRSPAEIIIYRADKNKIPDSLDATLEKQGLYYEIEEDLSWMDFTG